MTSRDTISKSTIVVSVICGGVVFFLSLESAHYSVGTTVPALALSVLAVVGVVLVSLGHKNRPALNDIGQGLIVGVVIAVAIGWWQSAIQHTIDVAAEEQNLQLTLTVQHDLTGIDLRGKQLPDYMRSKELREANLIEAHLEKADLTRSNLAEAQMQRSHLHEAIFRRGRLAHAEMPEAEGAWAEFEGIWAPGLGLEKADLPWANFAGAAIPGAYLEEAELQHASLTEAYMRNIFARGVNLEAARLERAHLRNADLTAADLNGANLIGADLTDAELGYADLTNAYLGKVMLHRATFNARTIWPEGFDPVAHGAQETR